MVHKLSLCHIDDKHKTKNI